MFKRSNLILILLPVLFFIYNCSKQDQKNVITIYTAIETDQLNDYLRSFRSKYPDIELEIVRNSTGIITAKLLAEKSNPRADLVWGLSVTSLMQAANHDMFEPYAPIGYGNIKSKFKDQNEVPLWVGNAVYMTGIVCNTIEMKNNNLPQIKSYSDLLDPIFKDKITMPNPASSGTGFLTVAGILQLKGEDQGWKYLDSLHKNIARYTHSGSKPAKLAGTGEYPIGISFGYRGIKQAQKGQPLKTVFPVEGSGWDMEANALIKKDKIKQGAKTFLDWAISEKIMREYGENFAVITRDIELETPDGFPEDPESQLIENDFEWASNNKKRIIEKWTNRYDTKSEPK